MVVPDDIKKQYANAKIDKFELGYNLCENDKIH